MTAKLTATLCLAAGLLGGIASRYISPDLTHAQAQTPVAKEIRAQAFILEDESGNVMGRLRAIQGTPGMPPPPPGARLKEPLTPGQHFGTLQLLDEKGRVLWSAPPPQQSPFRPAESR
jgi:hypothetical protein